MRFSEDFINPLDPLLKLMGPPDPLLQDCPMLASLAQNRQRKRIEEMSKSKGSKTESTPTKLDAVKKIAVMKAEAQAIRKAKNTSTTETRRLKAVNPNEYDDVFMKIMNTSCAFCNGKLPTDDSKKITTCDKCGVGLHSTCKSSLGACPKCLITTEQARKRMSIDEAMKLRDTSAEPPPLPKAPPPLPTAVKTGETKKTEPMKALPGPGIGPASGKKSDLDNTPITGTKIPKLPTAVKSDSIGSSTTTDTTVTSKVVVTPKPADNGKPTYPTYEQAKKIIAGIDINSTSASTRAALLQEWKGKIARLRKDGGRDEIKWEHIVASAISFVPKHKKVSRIRTLMKMLKITDVKTAKMIYDESGMADLPFIPHPGIEIADSSSDLKSKITELNKTLNDIKGVRADLMKEVDELDFEAQTAKEACLGIATEIFKVLTFIDEQLNAIFVEENDVHQDQFNFMRRVLTNELNTFELVKRRTEMEIIQGPTQDS